MQKASIIGNIGRDPEVRHTTAGRPVCSVGVAVHTGQDTPPIWWDCSVWGEDAMRFAEKVNKGDRVSLDGMLSLAMRKNGEEFIMAPKLNVKMFHIVSRNRNAEQTVEAPVEDEVPTEAYVGADDAASEKDDIPF